MFDQVLADVNQVLADGNWVLTDVNQVLADGNWVLTDGDQSWADASSCANQSVDRVLAKDEQSLAED